VHGAKEGQGKSYYSPSSPKAGQFFHEGQYRASLPEGQGRRQNPDGTYFVGSFMGGMDFTGEITSADGKQLIAKVISTHLIFPRAE